MRRPAGVLAPCLVLALLSAQPAARAGAPLGHRGRWLTDAHGRVVVLHGMNVVAKRSEHGYLPSNFGFDEEDAAFLAAQGFNTVRLGIIYKGLEGTRKLYDDAYLEKIAATARILGAHGIRVLVDFHQDMFNEAFNGEGFPDWAVRDDGLPHEPDVGFPGNYFVMPALWRAYDHFWANDPVDDGDVGLQDAYAAAWGHVAHRLAGEESIFGYDLFNETWPGSQWTTCLNPAGCPLFDAQITKFFRDKVFPAIRSADPHKLVFYETHPIFGSGADSSIGDTGDANAGFSFHVYCLGALGVPSDFGDASCPLGPDRPFERAEAQSQRTGDALLLSEFGATDDLGTIIRDVEIADRHMMSWQYWAYWNTDVCCERPHEGIIVNPGESPSGTNVKWDKIHVLARPYPRAVAGTPSGWSFDPETSVFEFSYVVDESIGAPTEIFVPSRHFEHGYDVAITGAAHVTSAANATLLTLEPDGPGAVTVRVTRHG